MRTPYADRVQFDEKAAMLAAELRVDTDEAGRMLAHLSGYADVAAVAYGAGDRSTWSSREELVARLLSSRPGMANDQAARVIDRLALPVRDADIDHVASSADAVPNMGG
nr:hypothetical protein [uncultured Noviherbaspirillum sp.]